MKKKELMGALALTGALTLLPITYKSHKFSLLSSKLDLLIEKNQKVDLDIVEIKLQQYAQQAQLIEAKDNYTITMYGIKVYEISVIDNSLYIRKVEIDCVLDEEVYQFINRVIQVREITHIRFSDIEENFDFSQINFTNIKRITLNNCQNEISKINLSNMKALEFQNCNIDLSNLDLSHIESLSLTECSGNLSNVDISNVQNLSLNCNNDLTLPSLINLKSLSVVSDNKDCIDFSKFSGEFENVELRNVTPTKLKEFFLQGDFSEAKITVTEEITKESNVKELLEILENNQISCEEISITQRNAGDYKGLTEEEFILLGNLNVKSINIDVEGFEKPINLDLTLNDTIQNIQITASKENGEVLSNGEKTNDENSELGRLNIKSNNKELHLSFTNCNITSNTHFSLPDQTFISFYSLDCTDITPFKDLRNVGYIWFKEDIKGSAINAFQNGVAVYTTNPNFIACYCEKDQFTYPPLHDDTFKDFDLFLEYLEKSYRLETLKNKLNILEESQKIYGISDIEGYPVHFGSFGTITEGAKVYKDIYSLDKEENSVNAYYGSSKTRCIRSFVMSNGKTPIEVYNVDDYNLFKEMGYELIGYNLVNDVLENPVTEFYCKDEGLKRVFTPFDKK